MATKNNHRFLYIFTIILPILAITPISFAAPDARKFKIIRRAWEVPLDDESHYTETMYTDNPVKTTRSEFQRSISRKNVFEGVRLLHKLAHILKDHGIEWCLYFGTMIGQYHYHNIIPWDDDWDVIVFAPRKKILEVMATALQGDEEFAFEDVMYILGKLYLRNGTRAGKNSWNWPFLDIAYADRRYGYVFTRVIDQIDENMIFPLGEGYFGGLLFPIVRNPLKTIDYMYSGTFGKTCMTWYYHKKQQKSYTVSIDCNEITEFAKVERSVSKDGKKKIVKEKLVRDGVVYYTLEIKENEFRLVWD